MIWKSFMKILSGIWILYRWKKKVCQWSEKFCDQTIRISEQRIFGAGINEILSVNPWPFWWHVTEIQWKKITATIRPSFCANPFVNQHWWTQNEFQIRIKYINEDFTKWFMNIFLVKIEKKSDLRKMLIFSTNIFVSSTKTKDTNNVTNNRNWSSQIDFNGL